MAVSDKAIGVLTFTLQQIVGKTWDLADHSLDSFVLESVKVLVDDIRDNVAELGYVFGRRAENDRDGFSEVLMAPVDFDSRPGT